LPEVLIGTLSHTVYAESVSVTFTVLVVSQAAESASLRTLLDDLGYTLPAPHTVGPLIKRLSERTLSLIHRAQLADILAAGLD